MSKFEAGQAVKVVKPLNASYAGYNGMVFIIPKVQDGLAFLSVAGNQLSIDDSWLEAIPVFKPGQRVRFKDLASMNLLSYPNGEYPSPTFFDFMQTSPEAIYKIAHSDNRYGVVTVRDHHGEYQVRNEWLTTSSLQESPMSDVFLKLKDSLFRKITDVSLDLQTLKAGVKLPTGVVTLEITAPEGENAEPQYELVTNQMSEFCLSLPAWATRVPIDNLSLGDIIVLDSDKLAFFIKKADNANAKNPLIVALEAESRNQVTSNLATNRLFGGGGVLAVRNAFSQTIGDVGGLLPMMMAADNESDMGRMLAIMSMMGAAGGKKDKKDQGLGQMLPFLLMGDKSLGIDPEKLMLLSAMNGGNGNPMMAMMMAKMFHKEAPAK